jgi:hypothetical protein
MMSVDGLSYVCVLSATHVFETVYLSAHSKKRHG